MNTNEPLTQIRSSCAPVLSNHADPRPRSAPVLRKCLLRALSWRIFIHVLEYPLTLSRLAGVRRGAFSIILVGNQITDSARWVGVSMTALSVCRSSGSVCVAPSGPRRSTRRKRGRRGWSAAGTGQTGTPVPLPMGTSGRCPVPSNIPFCRRILLAGRLLSLNLARFVVSCVGARGASGGGR